MKPKEHNFFTLAAVGFLAFYTVVMCHEILGHGGADYFYGARQFYLTSLSMGITDQPTSSSGWIDPGRVIAAAGSLSTIALSLILYPLLKSLFAKGEKPTLCLYVWLLVFIGFFHGFSYIAFSGLANVGDWSAVISDWPHPPLLRVLEVVLGTTVCAVIVRWGAPYFALFPESLTKLALVPYFAATVLFCVASIRLHNARYFMLISAIPGSLIGQAILPMIAPVARRMRTTSATMGAVPFSPTAVILALACLVATYFTAPGVRFSLP